MEVPFISLETGRRLRKNPAPVRRRSSRISDQFRSRYLLPETVLSEPSTMNDSIAPKMDGVSSTSPAVVLPLRQPKVTEMGDAKCESSETVITTEAETPRRVESEGILREFVGEKFKEAKVKGLRRKAAGEVRLKRITRTCNDQKSFTPKQRTKQTKSFTTPKKWPKKEQENRPADERDVNISLPTVKCAVGNQTSPTLYRNQSPLLDRVQSPLPDRSQSLFLDRSQSPNVAVEGKRKSLVKMNRAAELRLASTKKMMDMMQKKK